MDEIIAYISGIIDRGYGYTTNDGINIITCIISIINLFKLRCIL